MPIHGNQIRNVHGCNMAFRRVIFDRAGLWSKDIGARGGQSLKDGEEAELCLRISHFFPESIICYSPDAVVLHNVPANRACIGWVVRRSLMQGRSKWIIRSTVSSERALFTENSYLKYLVCSALPSKIARFFNLKGLAQAGAIMVCIAATGVGYLVGRVKAG
jgi:glucosyl-dolichyl phosphate glucuronosyltransferase